MTTPNSNGLSPDDILATCLAFEAINDLAKQEGYSGACFHVSPSLSIDNPQSIRGFDKFKSALLGAFRKGKASASAKFVLHSSTDGDWARLCRVNAEGSESVVSEGHSVGTPTLQAALESLGCSFERKEHPPAYFD